MMLIDSNGRTAMHNAAWGRDGGKHGKRRGEIVLDDSPSCVELLLNLGHPIEFPDEEGNTPLASASSSNGLDSMKLLMRKGANPNYKNKYNETPLWLACRYGHTDCAISLIDEFGANYEIPDNKGMTMLEAAGAYE